MSFDPNDPRLTAYALGELDEDDRSAVEHAIAQDPALAREVEEIRALSALLVDEFTDEDAVGLTDAQHRAIEETIMTDLHTNARKPSPSPDLPKPSKSPSKPSSSPKSPSLFRIAVPVVFAVVLATVGVTLWMQPAQDSAPAVQKEKLVTRVIMREKVASNADMDGDGLKTDQPVSNGIVLAQVENKESNTEQTLTKKADKDGRFLTTKPTRGPATVSASTATVAPNVPPITTALVDKKAEAKEKNRAFRQKGNDGWVANKDLEKAEDQTSSDSDVDRVAAGERYAEVQDNPFKAVSQDPLSTFSIDVDTASYSNMRRYITRDTLPPTSSVRVEEMINYFNYDYAPPTQEHPFAVHVETTASPWNPKNRLVRVGLKGREIERNQRPASNLVFLIDVSGSMSGANKLPLLIQSMKMLVRGLDARDHISIVVYAGASGLVLKPTPGDQKETIFRALDRLKSGGSTNGGAGIELAYKTAVKHFKRSGVNRVILATDGDFNVGTVHREGLTELIERKAKSGVFLSVLGFGMDNLNDANLEQLADKGNGNYAYIDTLKEAKKALVHDINGTLITIAKDVKIQVEFNPKEVASYRLIGYNNRILAARDFDDDTKDAGEIGAGHTVTALYELIPRRAHADTTIPAKSDKPLKYQDTQPKLNDAAHSGELLTLKLRYKFPDGDKSTLLEHPVFDSKRSLDEASSETQFAVSVAMFGSILRRSPMSRATTVDDVLTRARKGARRDPFGYRDEFLSLVERSKILLPKPR